MRLLLELCSYSVAVVDISVSPKVWVAPSFANAANISGLDPVLALKAGLDTDKNLKVFGAHQ
jgi:hypothetical protein